MRLFYVVAYDVPCNKRRKKISDWLEGLRTKGSIQCV